MENLREVLGNLKKARAILERSYVKWTIDDDHGGRCAVGAISEVKYSCSSALVFPVAEEEVIAVSETARALHPELAGAWMERPDLLIDCFDSLPIVYVNNHLGKGETLRVFDVTIAELELRLAAEQTEDELAEDSERALLAIHNPGRMIVGHEDIEAVSRVTKPTDDLAALVLRGARVEGLDAE